MLRLGAEAPSFETIVAAGANSAIPHHRPDATVLRDGDFLKLDFGATVDGYHSDMTRTLVLGDAADWQREIYELVAAAQAAGRAALAVGADVVAVDAAAARRDRRGRARRALHATASGTASGWRSTRRRASARSARVRWPPAWPSPWSRVSTFPAAAVSGSRTR